MMHRIITFSLIFCLATSLTVQAQKEHAVDLHVSIADAIPISFAQLVGSASYESKSGYIIGVGYHLKKGRNSFLTGLDFGRYSYNSSWIDGYGMEQHNTEPIIVSLLTIPLNYSRELRYRFHFGLGPFLGMELNPDRTGFDMQTGVGFNLFLQKRFRLGEKFELGITPELKLHSIIPTTWERYHRKMLEANLRLSLHKVL